MSKIALIGCTKQKQDYNCPAIEMYTKSNYFNLKLDYCKKINVDKIFILSAKYGLLEADEVIEPYDYTLKKAKKVEKLKWTKEVLKGLKAKTNIQEDEFIILAGNDYTKYLLKYIPNYHNPVEGLRIGSQMGYFKNYCSGE